MTLPFSLSHTDWCISLVVTVLNEQISDINNLTRVPHKSKLTENHWPKLFWKVISGYAFYMQDSSALHWFTISSKSHIPLHPNPNPNPYKQSLQMFVNCNCCLHYNCRIYLDIHPSCRHHIAYSDYWRILLHTKRNFRHARQPEHAFWSRPRLQSTTLAYFRDKPQPISKKPIVYSHARQA